VNDEGLLNFWRAYLVRVVRDLDEYPYQEAAEAFVLDRSTRPLGFEWTCSVLGINADSMRAAVLDRATRRRVLHGNKGLKRAA
jgi:hypothetical protein